MRFGDPRAARCRLLSARLRSSDLQYNGLRHYRDSGDVAVRAGVAVPIPVWDPTAAASEAQRTSTRSRASWKQARLTLSAPLAGLRHGAGRA